MTKIQESDLEKLNQIFIDKGLYLSEDELLKEGISILNFVKNFLSLNDKEDGDK